MGIQMLMSGAIYYGPYMSEIHIPTRPRQENLKSGCFNAQDFSGTYNRFENSGSDIPSSHPVLSSSVEHVRAP